MRSRQPLPAAWSLRLSFDDLSQTFNCGSDRVAWVAAETKHERRSRRCCNIQAAHCPDDDAVLAPGALDGYVRETSAGEGNEMHPLIRRIDREVFAETVVESGNQLVTLIAVQQAYSTNMRGEVPFFHEGGDERLAQCRWLPVHEIASGNERPQQRMWHHRVTDPQSRKQRLVECADVNDALTFIETLK